MKRHLNQAGDTLVEVVIAMTIISITLASAYTVATRSYRIGVQARERIEAVNIAQAQAEMLRAWRDQNIVTKLPTESVIPFPPGSFMVTLDAAGVFGSANCPSGCPVGRYMLKVTSNSTGPDFPTPQPDGRRYTISVEWTRIGGGPGAAGLDNTEVVTTLVDRRIDRSNIDCDEPEKCS